MYYKPISLTVTATATSNGQTQIAIQFKSWVNHSWWIYLSTRWF